MMTTWVVVATLYAGDGTKHYSRGDTYATSDLCFQIGDRVNRALLEAHAGWATCLPKEVADKLAPAAK